MRIVMLLGLCVSLGVHASAFFECYEELKEAIPYSTLASVPTPVQRCCALGRVLGHHEIFVKRDDLTGQGTLYGGNKVRKLEFLLADALEKRAKKVITFGCVGTNHGLATACHAQQLGLECLLMLKDQPNSPVVRQNLLLDHYFGADIFIFPNEEERKRTLDSILETFPDHYFIPTGGSVPLGALGYVNAAFELKEQITSGVLPEPDFIYVPVGSGGTVAGLLLGCVLADVHTHIIAVAVEPEETVNEVENTLRKLFEETNQLLSSVSSRIPMVSFPEERLTINKEFVGEEYGQWLRVGEDATRLMKNEENIVLEGTYSAKALAALIADCKNQKRAKHEIILFWNTYCGLDFSPLTAHINYRQLPNAVHHYFEDAHLVDVGQLYPAIELDLKFATKDNFTGEVLYGKKQCLLLKPVAEQLGKAAQEFKALGYTVKMWDGYRPSKVSARLWELMPDDNFIANPKDGGSRHNRGCAVDLTLVDATGRELDMGTCFCEFSEKAYRDSQNVSELVLNNRKFLEMIMEKHGFVGLKTEWWHFDFKDWLQYPSLGVSLDK